MRWKGGGFDNLRKYGKEIGQTARSRRPAPARVAEDPLCVDCGFKKSSHGIAAYRAGLLPRLQTSAGPARWSI